MVLTRMGCQELTDTFEAEEAAAEKEHAERMREVDEVGIAMLEDHEDMLEQARGRFEEVREAIRNMGNEAFSVLKASVQARIQEVERILVDRHKAYQKANGPRSQVPINPHTCHTTSPGQPYRTQ